QPPQPQSRAAGQHRRQSGEASVALWRHACRDGADRLSRAARACRRFARRPLCRRGVVDAMAAILPGDAAPGLYPLAAEIRAGALGRDVSELDDAIARLEAAVARLEAAA